jgi:hypothetical protein
MKTKTEAKTQKTDHNFRFDTIEYTVEYFRWRINLDQKWLEASIVAIYNYQTEDEKFYGDVEEHNGVGFNGSDSMYLTRCAKWIKSGNRLTDEYVINSRKKMMKYCAQLLRIALAKKDGKKEIK